MMCLPCKRGELPKFIIDRVLPLIFEGILSCTFHPVVMVSTSGGVKLRRMKCLEAPLAFAPAATLRFQIAAHMRGANSHAWCFVHDSKIRCLRVVPLREGLWDHLNCGRNCSTHQLHTCFSFSDPVAPSCVWCPRHREPSLPKRSPTSAYLDAHNVSSMRVHLL